MIQKIYTNTIFQLKKCFKLLWDFFSETFEITVYSAYKNEHL